VDRFIKSTIASWRRPKHRVELLLLPYDSKRGPWRAEDRAELERLPAEFEAAPGADTAAICDRVEFAGQVRAFFEALRMFYERSEERAGREDTRSRTTRPSESRRGPEELPIPYRTRGSTGRPLTYFAWFELTEKRFPHYHVMLVDPPFFWGRKTKAWLESIWKLGFVGREKKNASWFTRKAGAYVGKYADKWTDKRYQQEYDDVPREIRTYMNHRLPHTQEELKAHESKYTTTFMDTDVVDGTTRPVAPYIRIDAHVRHDCVPGGLRYVTKSQDDCRRRDSAARGVQRRHKAGQEFPRKIAQGYDSQVSHVGLRAALGRSKLEHLVATALSPDAIGIDIPKFGGLDEREQYLLALRATGNKYKKKLRTPRISSDQGPEPKGLACTPQPSDE
jgi:hypothetical protein